MRGYVARMRSNSDEDDFLRAVGRRLQAARKAAGFSLQAVADRLGLKTRATVGHWETGLNPVDIGKLWRLARLYGTSVLALVADDLSPDEMAALVKRHMEGVRSRAVPSAQRLGESATVLRKRASR